MAVVDTLYAAAGAAGAAGLLEIEPLRLAFGLIGAAVLVFLGVRTLVSAFRVRLGGEVPEEVAHAAARVRHRAGGDRVEPADDRLVGGGLRRGVDGRAPRPAAGTRCCWRASGSGA